MEAYIGQCLTLDAGRPVYQQNKDIQDFIDWSVKEVKQFLWSEGFCFSKELWIGGCSDFGFLTKDDKIIIGDYKTSKAIYWTNFLQTAGYGIQVKENGVLDKDGKKLLDVDRIDGYVIFQRKDKEPKVQWMFNTEELEWAFIWSV